MLEKTYNEVVRSIQTANADEFEQVLAQLPRIILAGLAEEIHRIGDAHRYDAAGKCAYYFVRQGDGVTVWAWTHVYRPHEAGELIFRVVSAPGSLDENLANESYQHATGRTVTHPGAPQANSSRGS